MQKPPNERRPIFFGISHRRQHCGMNVKQELKTINATADQSMQHSTNVGNINKMINTITSKLISKHQYNNFAVTQLLGER
jgi:hypothetical protein